MSAKIIDGKKIAQNILDNLQHQLQKLKFTPKLVIFVSKADARSQVYINMKKRRATEVGIEVKVVELDSDHQKAKTMVEQQSGNPKVTGIIVQLPLNGWYDPQELIDRIDPAKDVDGLTSTNQENLENNLPGLRPATPLAVIKILQVCKIMLTNKVVCVVGRSSLVGNPMRIMLEQSGAKVLVGHSNTKDLKRLTQNADIVISATGQPKLITANMVKPGAVVVDVGINDSNGKLQGDVDFDNVAKKASLITPVPGGVGPITVAMLLQNVVQAAKK